MTNFLNKEIRLNLAPVNYLFMAFSIMIIIPNYPCYVPFFYFALSVFFIFNNAELNRDIQYSMVLPITKKEIVKSRCILVFCYELAGLVFTIPFAILRSRLIPMGNDAGIEANVAFYGLVMIPLTLFNLIFFTKYYKKAEKPGLPFLFASIAYWVCYLLLEAPIWFKSFFQGTYIEILDKSDMVSLIKQLPVLMAGLVIFISGWILTYRISSKRFEKVDL